MLQINTCIQFNYINKHVVNKGASNNSKSHDTIVIVTIWENIPVDIAALLPYCFVHFQITCLSKTCLYSLSFFCCDDVTIEFVYLAYSDVTVVFVCLYPQALFHWLMMSQLYLFLSSSCVYLGWCCNSVCSYSLSMIFWDEIVMCTHGFTHISNEGVCTMWGW